MTRYQISVQAIIPAPPRVVYAVLSDYRRHHPRIVPAKYFRNIEVLEGGVGAGTRTRFEVHLFGKSQEVRHAITEPEPGRVLVESDLDRKTVTTFTVDPADGGNSSQLKIATDVAAVSGLGGVVERWVVSAFLHHVYRKELALISEYAPTIET